MLELNNFYFSYDLAGYIFLNPSLSVKDFDDSCEFKKIKSKIKVQLNREQDGLCVYCERKLDKDKGQIEHIKPKSGRTPYPHLCFQYSNYAHSCINPKTCGQKKKDGILPIEPKIGCNDKFSLLTDGTILPIKGLTRREKHLVIQTRDMLGLNTETLRLEREKVIKTYTTFLQNDFLMAKKFIKEEAFRDIIKKVIE